MGHLEAEARFLSDLQASGVQVGSLDLPDEPGAEALVLLPPGRRTDHAVVFSHGGGNDRLYGLWYVVEQVLAQGHAIVTAHLPGHGRNGTDHFTLPAARKRLDAMVAAARSTTGCDPFVVGQSMGGALVLDLVLRRSRVLGAVLVSAPVSLRLDARLLGEFTALASPACRKAYRYVGLWGALPAGGRFKRWDFPVRVPGRSYIQAFADLLDALDLPARCEDAEHLAPLLILHGQRDGIIPVANAHRLYDALHGHATLRIVPDAWHLDPLLHAGVVTDLIGWLRTVGKRAES